MKRLTRGKWVLSKRKTIRLKESWWKESFQYSREILHLLGKDRRKLPWMILLFLGSTMLDLAGLGLIGPYIAAIMNPDPLLEMDIIVDPIKLLGFPVNQGSLIICIGLILVFIFLLKGVIASAINYKILRFSYEQELKLRSQLTEKYQSMPYIDYVNRNSAEYIYGINSLCPTYSSVVLISVLHIASNTIVIFALMIILALSDPMTLMIMVILLGGMTTVYYICLRKKMLSYGEEINKSNTIMLKYINETFGGLKEVRVLGKEDYFLQNIKSSAKSYGESCTKSFFYSSIPRYLLEFGLVLFMVTLTISIILLGKEPQEMITTLALFGAASVRLLPGASIVSDCLFKLRKGRDAIALLYEDYKQPILANKATHTVGDNVIPEEFRNLTMDGMSFSYPNTSSFALKNICMEIKYGESIGIMGPSGSGKTTLMDLLLGLLEPQEGNLCFNGRPLDETLTQWRSQVAYLPQQVFLIDDTLCRNIALGEKDERVDHDRVREALRQARLLELVDQLPQGTETLIGERGVRLSGGQRQRVALARAFYHERNILVMDEATSALDNETEREIVDEIQRLKGRKTTIVIAHRLTTLQHCDRIYELVDGEIVHTGSYKEMTICQSPRKHKDGRVLR